MNISMNAMMKQLNGASANNVIGKGDPMATTHPANHIYGQLLGREAIRRYLLGGNCTLTLVSKTTGRRFTYRVKSAAKDRNQNWSTNNQNRDLFFVSVLTGGDNNSSYTYIGMLRRNAHDNAGSTYQYQWGHKSKLRQVSAQSVAFDWFVKMMEQFKPFEDKMEFWHEGKCGRCGRKLTVPESVASGIGPECAGKE